MKKKLITLAKELDFSTEEDYMNYLIDCYLNGNLSSCDRRFLEMRKADRLRFVLYCEEHEPAKEVHNFYFSRL